MMKELSLSTLLLLICLVLNGCNTFPVVEWCLIGNTQLYCTDLRLPKGKQDYVKPFAVNDICTNPQDFQTIQGWIKDHDK